MTPTIPLPALPIVEALSRLGDALAAHSAVVLEAPPGAGKSTVVPLSLLDASWRGHRKILMLEPRRLAARAVATRLAETLGEPVGRTVGYRMRLDTKVSSATVIEVVTEGILTRMLEADPALEEIAIVIFDEFHERSLSADLGLALCRDAQLALRPDLRLLVMSATLDGEAIAALLGDAPRITSSGQSFPVETRYAERTPEHLEREVIRTILSALAEEPGDILVFLPGVAEIRRAANTLMDCDLPSHVRVFPLFGELSSQDQQRAITRSPTGERKVVLATSIAETSLTIEGIRIVVDAGLSRRTRFNPGSGMSRLDTLPASLASADQRRGRAGRLEAGICYRLYTTTEERRRPTTSAPEIIEADLAPLALDLASWGTPADALTWLDPPPAAHLSQARTLLTALGALDADGRCTALGRSMTRLGAHPRLARMLLAARGTDTVRMACRLAALLSERDPVRWHGRDRDSSLDKRLELLAGGSVPGLEADRQALATIRRLADSWERLLVGRQPQPDETLVIDVPDVGALLACAYPDRIARRRAESSRYHLSNGSGAAFAGPDSLSQHEFLVIADLDGAAREARIMRAAAVTLPVLGRYFSAQMERVPRLEWNRRDEAVSAAIEHRIGQLVLQEAALTDPPAEATIEAMLDGLRTIGVGALPWTTHLRDLQTRVAFLRRVLPTEAASLWPDLSDEAFTAHLAERIGPFLGGITRRSHLERLDLAAVFTTLLPYSAQRDLDRLAPTHLTVPSGSSVPIDYSADPPRLSVRLQEVFGLTVTPRVAGGHVALALELLSPARRPVQVTRDLESFWARGYDEVKRELKGRYPKHYWPDDPRHAEPTARARPRPR